MALAAPLPAVGLGVLLGLWLALNMAKDRSPSADLPGETLQSHIGQTLDILLTDYVRLAISHDSTPDPQPAPGGSQCRFELQFPQPGAPEWRSE